MMCPIIIPFIVVFPCIYFIGICTESKKKGLVSHPQNLFDAWLPIFDKIHGFWPFDSSMNLGKLQYFIKLNSAAINGDDSPIKTIIYGFRSFLEVAFWTFHPDESGKVPPFWDLEIPIDRLKSQFSMGKSWIIHDFYGHSMNPVEASVDILTSLLRDRDQQQRCYQGNHGLRHLCGKASR